MIVSVSGKLVEKRPTDVVVEVNGLGYQVFIPTSTYERLPEQSAEVHLFTHHYVREDAVLLYGFSRRSERALFQLLIGVSGIGPRLALAALSAMPPQTLRNYITEGNSGALATIPGIGKKTADRIVVELRDRALTLDLGEVGTPRASDGKAEARADALAALEQLGLSRAAAEKSIRNVLRSHPEVGTADELVRLALQSGT